MPEPSKPEAVPDESPISRLVERIIQGSGRAVGGEEERRAVVELAAAGGAAIEPILDAMGGPFPRGIHGQDVFDGMNPALHMIAKVDPEPLIEFVLREVANPTPHLQLYHAVGVLETVRRGRVFEALLAATRHPDPWIRRKALEGLIRRRDRRSIEPVIRAVCDRSPVVRLPAVLALNGKSNVFRVPEAAVSLRRLLRYKDLEKKDPRLFHNAKEALEKIESDSMRG